MGRATALAALVAVAVVGVVAIASGMLWGSNTGSASPGPMTCSVKASCGAGEVEVFRMSSPANAHAATPGGSSYVNKVCCGDVQGLGTNCAATPSGVVLSLSGTDNGHVASDGSYGTEVCLSGNGDDATAAVAYGASCDVDYACLATISGSTNAHVADCDGSDDYATKVCGLVTGDNCPTTPNPGQENADGDKWGDACENCPSVATVWWVPVGDGDCDGFTDTEEGTIGTDPTDACGTTCWPPDWDDNKTVNLMDLLPFKPHFNKTFPDPLYDVRYDLNLDNSNNLLDLLPFKPFFNLSCTP
jgi:hypothetical protein